MMNNVIFIYFNNLECLDEYRRLDSFLKQAKGSCNICYVLATKLSVKVRKYIEQQKVTITRYALTSSKLLDIL